MAARGPDYFELSDCKPTDETARLIQTSAQASFKLDALVAAAETLGIRDLAGLDPGLASIIVGAPLVAATSITVGDNQSQVTPAAPSDPDADEVR